MFRGLSALFLVGFLMLGSLFPCQAYVDTSGDTEGLAPGLFFEQFESVSVVTVEKLNAGNTAVIFKVTGHIWGRSSAQPVGSTLLNYALPPAVHAKLKVAQKAVLLHDIEALRMVGPDRYHLVFTEGGSYQSVRDGKDGPWKFLYTRDYSTSFMGSVAETASMFRKLAQGEEVVVRRKTSTYERKMGAKEYSLRLFTMQSASNRYLKVPDTIKEPTTKDTFPETEPTPPEFVELKIPDVRVGNSNGAWDKPEGKVRAALHPLPGVLYVNFKSSNHTRVYYKDKAPTVEALSAAVEKAGFRVADH